MYSKIFLPFIIVTLLGTLLNNVIGHFYVICILYPLVNYQNLMHGLTTLSDAMPYVIFMKCTLHDHTFNFIFMKCTLHDHTFNVCEPCDSF